MAKLKRTVVDGDLEVKGRIIGLPEVLNEKSNSTTDTYSAAFITENILQADNCIISSTEPTGDNRKSVWFQQNSDGNKIYILSEEDVYEIFYSWQSIPDVLNIESSSTDDTYSADYINQLVANISEGDGIKELESPVRIWGLDDNVYKLPQNCVIYYSGETSTTSTTIASTSFLFVTSNSNYKTFLIVSGSNTTTRYLYHGYSSDTTGSISSINLLNILTTANVQNNLTYNTSDSTNVLSAYQGYQLDQKKVDKVNGKGLSTEDYTTAEKTKVGTVEESAQVNKIETIKVNGVVQDVSNKTVNLQISDDIGLENLPIGSKVGYTGDEENIPEGWEKVEDVNSVIVSSTEPTGDNRKVVWFQENDNGNKIYILNNDVYEEFSVNGSGEDVDYIFEWDGKSSSTNPDNITLFQKIYDKQKEKNVLILAGQSTQYFSAIQILKDSLTGTGSRTPKIYTPIAYTSKGNQSSGYTAFLGHYFYAQIGISGDNVTSVTALTSSNQTISFLSTGYDYPNPYIPQYNGSPATKKYVDDTIIVGDEKSASDNTQIIIEESDVGEYPDIDKLPVGSIIDYDGDTVPDGYEEVDDPSEYSTTEHRVGTWIDGKPIYRKTVEFDTISSSYNMSISNIKSLIDIKGIIYRKDYNIFVKVPCRINESGWIVTFGNIQNGVININYGSAWVDSNFKKIVITIEYTKTTD